MALPNLILIGAPRCGTTSLFHWLAAHPDVSAARTKEAQYLVDPGSSIFHDRANFRDHGLSGYADLFPEAPVVFDATPGYLYQRTALDVIARDLPDARLLVVLRNPTERFLSAHRYFTHNHPVLDVGVTPTELFERSLVGDASLPANEFVADAVAHGEYARVLAEWVAACGRERLMLVLSEDIRDRPAEVLTRIAAWTGLDPAPLLAQEFVAHNVSYSTRRHGIQRVVARARRLLPSGAVRAAVARAYRRLNVVTPATGNSSDDGLRARLQAHYEPWNRQLSEQFGLDLTSWRDA